MGSPQVQPKEKASATQKWGLAGVWKRARSAGKTGHAHNARGCLLFVQREGTCVHGFMQSIGIYDTGCTYYGSARKNKHETPSLEPPEHGVVTAAGNAKTVKDQGSGLRRGVEGG